MTLVPQDTAKVEILCQQVNKTTPLKFSVSCVPMLTRQRSYILKTELYCANTRTEDIV